MSGIIRILMASLAISVASDALAGSHKPALGGDFTFRKIKPPKPGTKKRITVQVPPAPERKIVEAPKEEKKAPPSDLDWFWNEVKPEIAASVPGRFNKAVLHLSKAPRGKGLPTPRLEALKAIAASHGRHILIETLDKKVSPALVLALISVESAGKTDAVSNKGAQGLMQLIPATAERFGVTDATIPAQNIKGGVAYLDWLMREFKGDPILALAGYNAGEGAVREHGGVPPYAETRAYVPKVLAAWTVARGLCMTPPELPTDGCVFRTSGS